MYRFAVLVDILVNINEVELVRAILHVHIQTWMMYSCQINKFFFSSIVCCLLHDKFYS